MSSVPEISPRTRFAGFEILQTLGSGGFGITYLARDLKTNAHYAMKEYFPTDLASRGGALALIVPDRHQKRFQQGLDAFYNEANILRGLPKIEGLISVRGLFKRNGTAYVVMEYVEGVKLTDIILGYLKHDRPFPEDLVRRFVDSIGQALAVIHKAGLLHRDIKPDNILVRKKDGQPILIDFGAAKHSNMRSEIQAYTPSFAAIEQVPPRLRASTDHYKEGPWTDLFALSMVAYVMMTGRKPVPAELRLRTIAKGEHDPYVPVTETGGEKYSPELCSVVNQGCALDPTRRPLDAKEYLAQLGIDLKPISKTADPGAQGNRTITLHIKREVLLLGGLAVLALLAVTFGLLR
ncbi:MAG: serine/threonine-protein kinase [Pseudomonadota bacterium]